MFKLFKRKQVNPESYLVKLTYQDINILKSIAYDEFIGMPEYDAFQQRIKEILKTIKRDTVIPYSEFSGSEYCPMTDKKPLYNYLVMIKDLMKDGKYRTLQEISAMLNYSTSSVSAQLRNLRKPQFGEHIVNKRRHDKYPRIWEYQLILRDESKQSEL